jgi:thiamine pyrophosphokinase
MANGDFPDPTCFHNLHDRDDFVIAADGGLKHLLNLEILPDVLIGDLDSVQEDYLEHLRTKEVKILSHPPQKDETDLELALLHAAGQGADEIIVFGALGARWDMSLGNILLLAHPALRGVQVRLRDGPHALYLMKDIGTLTIEGTPGDIVSLLPLCGDAEGITTEGLAYALQDGTLAFGASRGISNVLNGDQAHIELSSGCLCVVHRRA